MRNYEAISKILLAMVALAKPGVTTAQIDKRAEELIQEYGMTSVNKGYKPAWAQNAYPAVSCISVNGEIGHGVPGDYQLKEGDLVSFDLGIKDKEGNCADAALTIGIGEIANKDRHLLKYAKRVLYAAIKEVKAGVSTEVITQAIINTAARYGYTVNRRFAGHTIGKSMHMEPKIYNTFEGHNVYAKLVEGQVICIEPFLTYGKDDIGTIDKNGWTTYTKDLKNSAFFEHMVRVTKDGYEILTTHIAEGIINSQSESEVKQTMQDDPKDEGTQTPADGGQAEPQAPATTPPAEGTSETPATPSEPTTPAGANDPNENAGNA